MPTLAQLHPRYLFNRARVRLAQELHPDWPWLTADAVRALESLLGKSDVGFEWGTGRSTLWFARRVKKITSVDHDRIWHEKITAQARDLGLDNVETVWHEVNSPNPPPVPDDYPYIAEIDKHPNNYFGFILVDAEYRDQCALKALEHLQSGGLLIIDNINLHLPNDRTVALGSRRTADGPGSDRWQTFLQRTATFRRLWTSNGLWDTAIWFKP
jgi:hypothetical protein